MGKNIKVKFKFSVGVLFSLLLLVMMTIVIIYNYKRTSSIIYTMSGEIVDNSSQVIMQKTENFLLPVRDITSFLSKQIDSKDYFQDKENLLETMWDFMDMYEQITFIYISDEIGNWVQVRKAPELSTRVINRNNEDPKSHTETWRYRDKNRNIISVDTLKPEYDHRVRQWYIDVVDEYRAYWTDVYIFASIGRPGITVSYPLIDKESSEHFGVISTDITFQDLSHFLKENSGEYSQTSFIINSKNEIIAHPNMEELIGNSAMENTRIDDLEEYIKIGYSKLINSRKDNLVYNFKGSNYFIKTNDFQGLENDWSIITVLPDTLFPYTTLFRSDRKSVV